MKPQKAIIRKILPSPSKVAAKNAGNADLEFIISQDFESALGNSTIDLDKPNVNIYQASGGYEFTNCPQQQSGRRPS